MHRTSPPVLLLAYLLISARAAAAEPGGGMIGVARVDITPDYPIHLTGYAARTNMGSGKVQTLWAKALALGSDADGPRILITADNCGIPANVVEEVAGRLALKAGIRRENLAVASSHTHSGPMVRGFAENIFVHDLTPEQASASDRYTREVTDRIEQAALSALRDRRPGRLYRTEGRVGFAANRRTPGGPVDHSLPLLVARDVDGRLRAVVANYACHCTTLGHQVNQCHGDWAGFAQEFIEADNPGAVGMITIGCGADSNPSPRGGDDFGIGWARTHGRALATEVLWLVDSHLEPLPVVPSTTHQRLWLPFQPLPTREEWEKRATESGIVGYHAKKNLARLDRKEALPTRIPYFVQTWSFDDRMAMVFLAGEVVVDYALRLKKEYDPARLWITAYANDVPCYIPSRRILAEGGYEAESSLWYYDRPARLAGEVEDLIHTSVTNQLPSSFRLEDRRPDSLPPRSPEESLLAFRTRPGWTIDLVASEPLVESPVAIDFGADGRLWVCEMVDYPSGLDGQGKPGGRVKVMTDRNGDGRYDDAVTVADGLPFPTGLMAYRDGVLVCAAPDVLFVPEGTGPAHGPGDPRVRRLLTGFATHNFQARVNGLRWGLDGWIYGSGALFGGKVQSLLTGREVDASGRDFRWHPDTGEFEALAGVSQQGRVRDDFGEWFGNDNGSLLWHFPLADRYSRRNPHFAPPEPRAVMNRDDGRVFPSSTTLSRFNDPQAANHLTSVCGPEIYRDDLAGAEFAGNAFTCEPVHNLVRRARVEPEGATFGARRVEDERSREFLSSRDNWFRPVEVRTGPDGALWVVDMYRFVVEHPRWISPERLKELDVRAGADRGRIYRLHPARKAPRPIRNLRNLDATALVRVLESPNGVERDLAQRLLLERGVTDTEAALLEMAKDGQKPPATRVQAMHTLALAGGSDSQPAGKLPDAVLETALKSSDTRLVRAILPLAEGRPGLEKAVAALAGRVEGGADPGLAFQLGLSLGEWKGAAAAEALVRLGSLRADPWMRAALLSSATTPDSALGLARLVGDTPTPGPGDPETLRALLETLAGLKAGVSIGELCVRWVSPLAPNVMKDRLWVLFPLQEVLVANGEIEKALREDPNPGIVEAVNRLQGQFIPAALKFLGSGDPDSLPSNSIPGAIRLLGEKARLQESDAPWQLIQLLDSAAYQPQRPEILRALSRSPGQLTAAITRRWSTLAPTTRRDLIGILLERDEAAELLGDAVAKGWVQPSELDATQRRRLLERVPSHLKEKLAGLVSAPADGGRAAVLKSFAEAASLTGHAANGGAHFDKLCATCHQYRGHGQSVGPDLVPFAPKPPADFLVAIVDPNAAIDPRYLAYDVTLRDGRELSGVVRAETGTSITLAQAGGVAESLLRSEIRGMRAQGRSLMPDGLEQGMSPQDLADLIAWLKTGPAQFGSASAAQAAAARQSFIAAGASRVFSVNSGYPSLPYASWVGSKTLHYCRQTDGRSRVQWQAEPAARATNGAAIYRFPTGMGFRSQPTGDFELKLGGSPVLRFGVSLGDGSWASSDGRVRMRYSAMETGEEDSNGVLEIEADGAPAAGPMTFEVTGSAAASERWFGIYDPI